MSDRQMAYFGKPRTGEESWLRPGVPVTVVDACACRACDEGELVVRSTAGPFQARHVRLSTLQSWTRRDRSELFARLGVELSTQWQLTMRDTVTFERVALAVFGEIYGKLVTGTFVPLLADVASVQVGRAPGVAITLRLPRYRHEQIGVATAPGVVEPVSPAERRRLARKVWRAAEQPGLNALLVAASWSDDSVVLDGSDPLTQDGCDPRGVFVVWG